MFALAGLVALYVVIFIRPHEAFPALQRLPILYLFLGGAIFGLALDVRLRLNKLEIAPQLPWVALFVVWCAVSLLFNAPPSVLMSSLVELAIPVCLYLVTSQGVQSFRGLVVLSVTLVAIALFLSFVGIAQHHAPRTCHMMVPGVPEGLDDGRPCEKRWQCHEGSPEPGAEYTCERSGPMGTSTTADRVRYRGTIADPNELALALAICLPFAFALFERRRSSARLALLLVTAGMIGLCVVYTQSRGGQLVFLSVLGTYFVRRYGWRGAMLGALAALPMLMFGGRSGEEAEGSAEERLECWAIGIELFRSSPIWGVGQGLFTEHHYLTAHNSYVLAPAELGLVGFVLWSTILYLSVKIPFMVLVRDAQARSAGSAIAAPLAPVARTYGGALLASMAGIVVGVFFLSYCYNHTLWIFFGLCGALHAAMRRHDPTFRVRVSLAELVAIAAMDLAVIVAIFGYTRMAL